MNHSRPPLVKRVVWDRCIVRISQRPLPAEIVNEHACHSLVSNIHLVDIACSQNNHIKPPPLDCQPNTPLQVGDGKNRGRGEVAIFRKKVGSVSPTEARQRTNCWHRFKVAFNLRRYPFVVCDNALVAPKPMEAARIMFVNDLDRRPLWLQCSHHVHLSVVGWPLGSRRSSLVFDATRTPLFVVPGRVLEFTRDGTGGRDAKLDAGINLA